MLIRLRLESAVELGAVAPTEQWAIDLVDRSEKGLKGDEASLGIHTLKVVDAADMSGILDRHPQPDVWRNWTSTVACFQVTSVKLV